MKFDLKIIIILVISSRDAFFFYLSVDFVFSSTDRTQHFVSIL